MLMVIVGSSDDREDSDHKVDDSGGRSGSNSDISLVINLYHKQ